MVSFQKDCKNYLKLDSKIFIKKCQLRKAIKYSHIITATTNQDLNSVMQELETWDVSVI